MLTKQKFFGNANDIWVSKNLLHRITSESSQTHRKDSNTYVSLIKMKEEMDGLYNGKVVQGFIQEISRHPLRIFY